jgi:hypothetical protein
LLQTKKPSNPYTMQGGTFHTQRRFSPQYTGKSTLFPVLTSFRSNLPLQKETEIMAFKEDYQAREALFSTKGEKASPHGGSPKGYTHDRFGHRQAIHTLSDNASRLEQRQATRLIRAITGPSLDLSQASTPRQTGTSMARTKTSQP